ncbi:MAG: LuxR C-terminal-related transcriptional regulator [Burkholderiales bacterium]
MARAIVVHLVTRGEGALADWRRTLSGAGYRVSAFPSGAEFLAHGLPSRPDCVVVEATLEYGDELDLQQRILHRDPAASVVFASEGVHLRTVVRAMRAGAIDFLEMPVSPLALLEAVAHAAERTAALRDAELRRFDRAERFERLTPRERAILDQVLEGRLNKQIAATLGCKEATVKVHRSRLMRKLGVRSLARLVQLAHEAGLGRLGAFAGGVATASAAARDPVDQPMPLDRVIEPRVHRRTATQGISQPAI